MDNGYFHRINRLTPTIFWINNPTPEEAHLAISAGARGCTCNPSFCQKMLDHPAHGPRALELLDQALRNEEDDNQAQSLLQRMLAADVIRQFRPMYEARPDRDGYVSLQGNPILEEDSEAILREARANRAVAPNVCIKVPCTRAGLTAMEELMDEGTPINATEVMSLAQTHAVLDLHERRGRRSVLFISHIAGIFDDYLSHYVTREKVDIDADVLWQAGIAVARKVYALMRERKSPAIFVAGGARGLHHFTELVGGELVVTINWKGTADQLIEQNPPVVYRMFNPVPDHVIAELRAKLPDFRRAWDEDGLSLDEFGEFGPVEHFRHMFLSSWKRVLGLARERRQALGLV